MELLNEIVRQLLVGGMGFFAGLILVITALSIRDRSLNREVVQPPTYVTAMIGLSYALLAISAMVATFYGFENDLHGTLVTISLVTRFFALVTGMFAIVKIALMRRVPTIGAIAPGGD